MAEKPWTLEMVRLVERIAILDDRFDSVTPAGLAARDAANVALELFNHCIDVHGELTSEAQGLPGLLDAAVAGLVGCLECQRLRRAYELAEAVETLARCAAP